MSDWATVLGELPENVRSSVRDYLCERNLAKAVFAGDPLTTILVLDGRNVIRFKARLHDFVYEPPTYNERSLYGRALNDSTTIERWLRCLRSAGVSLDRYIRLVATLAANRYCAVCSCFFDDDDNDGAPHIGTCLPWGADEQPAAYNELHSSAPSNCVPAASARCS